MPRSRPRMRASVPVEIAGKAKKRASRKKKQLPKRVRAKEISHGGKKYRFDRRETVEGDPEKGRRKGDLPPESPYELSALEPSRARDCGRVTVGPSRTPKGVQVRF